MNKFNIQLYSVRESLKADFKGTLKKLAEMGFDGVEFASGYYGDDMSPEQLREYLDFVGLSAVSAHVGLEELENNLDHHLNVLNAVGAQYIICPMATVDNAEQAIEIGERLKVISEKCVMQGINLGYHNHAHEFKRDEETGRYLFDIMMDAAGDLVLAELDVCWVGFEGNDIEEVIRAYAGKVNIIHLKQFIEEDGKKHPTTLDKGVIDFEKIVATAKLMGTQHFVIELDNPITDELSDAKTNIDFAKKIKA